MRTPLRILSVPAAVAAACTIFTGAALAATGSYSGTVANGGCDSTHAVPVTGPSRIEVSLSSTSASNNVRAEIVAPNGQTVATGSYDTTGAGAYSVRVCSTYDAINAPTVQYTALIGTGPAGQQALKSQADTGAVLGVQAFVGPRVSGKAALLTRSGLAWFTVSTASNDKMTLRIFDPVHRTTRVVKGLTGIYDGTTLRITGSGLMLVVHNGASQRVMFTSSRFKTSGKVARGGFQITA